MKHDAKPFENFTIRVVTFEDHSYAWVEYRALGGRSKPMGRRASIRLRLRAEDIDTGDVDSFLVLLGEALADGARSGRR